MASWSLIFRLETESVVFPQNFDGVSQPFRPAAWDSDSESVFPPNSFPKFVSISTMWHGPVLKLDAPGISFIETPIIDLDNATSFGFVIDFNLMYYLNSTDCVVIQYKDTTQSVWKNILDFFDNPFADGLLFYLASGPIPASNPLADQILGFLGNSNGILNRRFQITPVKINELGLSKINLRVSLGTTGTSSSAGVFFDDMVIADPTVLINESFEAGVIPPGWSTGTINSATPWNFKLPVSKPNSLYLPDLVPSLSLGQGLTNLTTPDFTLSDLSIFGFQMKWDLKAFNKITLDESRNNGITFSPIPIERFILNGYNAINGWSGTTNNVFRSIKLFLPSNITNVRWITLFLNPPTDPSVGAGFGVQIDNVTVSPLNNVTPTVSNAVTFENIQTISGLQINVDNENVTFFKITNIMGGTLFLFDGVSPVLDGDFILVDEGNDGLKFTPNSPNNGS
ncbi:MAG: hypothetical protein WD512_03020, partial [Candidatus Paceibacterota bacterium]